MLNDRLINYVRNPETKIKKFTIYGERHSGTKLLQKSISLNFKAKFTNEYGHKHFFGFTDIGSLANSYDTIFICIVRNPYYWILANNKQPHHCPLRNLDLVYFKDWYSIYPNKQEILEDRCYWDNLRYKDIYELRYWKTLYLLNILPIIVHNYIFIRYEDFVLDQLYHIYNINYLFDMEMSRRSSDSSRITNIEPAKKYEILKNDLEYINSNIRWNTEKECGYYKKDYFAMSSKD
jgi:hypothetical protein